MTVDANDEHGVSRVTVVVITMDRREEVKRSVERLLSLPERPPVIVVDNGSSDGTVEMLRSIGERLTVIPLDYNGGAAGRNVGVRRAATPYVAFTDDDSAWFPGALGRGVAVLDSHPRVAVVAARVVLGDGQRADQPVG